MKKLRPAILLISVLLSVSYAFSQEISVESFRRLDNDLTANTFGTTEYDQNGQVAALIKVVTVETGFVFDAGMMGIVKTIQQAGEIWVYVPFGLQRITIAHPELGVLRDYYFPESIEKARTYELRLKTVRPERAESDLIPNVNVTFDNPTEKAGIYLNGAFIGTGSWSGLVAASTFLLEVKQEGYVTYSTTITIEADKPEQTISIPQLEPVKGQIMANSIPSNATVYMDGTLKGKSPLLIEGLSAGSYNLEFRMRGYRPFTTTVTVKTDETYKSDAILKRVNDNVYAGVGYQYGHVSGITAIGGVYFRNFNLEIGYLKHSVPKEQTYWMTVSDEQSGLASVIGYEFTLKNVLTGSLGYGIPIGKSFCLTPNLGLVLYGIDSECTYMDKSFFTDDAIDSNQNASSYTMSCCASARLEYSPIRHFAFTVTPSYEIPISKGSVASTLDENTDIIRKWCGGFSVQASVKLYF